MDNAELYSLYNSMQRQDTETVLAEFTTRLSWTEGELVLDIGCGPGDVTVEVLMPRLPVSAKLVGVDISKSMVDYANNKYSKHQVEFKAVDFSTKHITNFLPEQRFSKVFSFYCLHWIQDQEQAFKNMFTLLKPGGHFLVIMAPQNSTFLIYKILSQMEKWKTYMKDVDMYIPKFYNSANVCNDIEQIVRRQGLEIITLEERKQTVSFPSMAKLMRSNEAVNPFVKRMNQSTREQYMACFEQVIEDQQLISETVTGEILTQNSLVVVYGRRPSQ
ncbi:juvenile hormone acid O-methyltransferase-like [Macrosteles quadrilineatus]|uniref:juvenile hormone acid O-methyltransferase-like n=1 Tax=Macrosteles quadrilineatus TaxID=74068 RepID=UPI0023E1FBD4|nr:juvenile hormone acid O-methyltransferase-like [Macrosteles quadrilineatus]